MHKTQVLMISRWCNLEYLLTKIIACKCYIYIIVHHCICEQQEQCATLFLAPHNSLDAVDSMEIVFVVKPGLNLIPEPESFLPVNEKLVGRPCQALGMTHTAITAHSHPFSLLTILHVHILRWNLQHKSSQNLRHKHTQRHITSGVITQNSNEDNRNDRREYQQKNTKPKGHTMPKEESTISRLFN